MIGKVDWKTVLFVAFGIVCLVSASLMYGLSGSTPSSGPYYLSVPTSSWAYLVNSFSNGSYYMVNGTNWHVDYQDTNATTVINYALGNLTNGRTWKEKVLIIGNFTGLSRITLASYITIELQGFLQAKALLNTHFIYGSGLTQVEIYGGTIDGNGAAQTASMDTIYFGSSSEVNLHDLTIGPACRPTSGDGENIELETCRLCTVRNCFTYLGIYSYDHIKLTTGSSDCLITNNLCNGTDGPNTGTRSGAIQLASDATRIEVANNVIIGCHFAGIKMDGTNGNYIHGNTIVGVADCQAGIDLIGTSSNNQIIGNFIYNVTAYDSIRVREIGGSDRLYDNVIKDNYIQLPDVNSARGIYLQSGGVRTKIIGNIVIGGTGTGDYGIRLTATDNTDTWIEENDVSSSALTTSIYNLGTTTTIKRNLGFVTENSGSAVNATATTFAITHGLAGTPTGVWCSFNTTALTAWTWASTSSTITVTMVGPNNNVTCYWKAEYVP